MRHLAFAALAACLPWAPAAAQVAISPLDGHWTGRPAQRAITGCTPELEAALERMARVMQRNLRPYEIAWGEDRFNVDSLRRAQPERDGAAWYQLSDELIVAVPPHGDADPAEAPVKVWLRLVSADRFESHTMLDLTHLRRLQDRPIAPGTESCRLTVSAIYEHDL